MSECNSEASNKDFEFKALQEAHNYRQAIVKEFAPWIKGRVAEVGAGIGQITEDISRLPAVDRLVAVEPDERFHQYHLNKPWDLIKSNSAKLCAKEGWDCILLINVLEHIEKDDNELKCLYELLKKRKGAICLLVPACPELYAAIDQDFGHYRRYTKVELESKMQAAGFQVEHCYYFNWAGYLAWAVVMKLMRKRNFSKLGVQIYDRIIFPVVYWTETHLGRPFRGQSLIAVGRAR